MRPLQQLNTLSNVYPDAWKRVDELRTSRGVDLPKWPAWCFVPMAGWYAIVSAQAGLNQLPLHLIPDVARLAAIGTWRYTQGIYRFDEQLASALGDTLLKGEIPAEVLYRLPEWSAYIETPGRTFAGKPLFGFWVHLEWEVNTERTELRLLLDADDRLIPQILHIGPWTLTEAVDRWFSEAKNQVIAHRLTVPAPPDDAIEALAAELQPLLAFILYLCSEAPEIEDREQPGLSPKRPKPEKTKRGWRLFAAKKPRIWTVGSQIGEVLRQANTSLPGEGKKSPHIRRAHWHGYWTGSRQGEQQFNYKWLPPMLIAAPPDEERK